MDLKRRTFGAAIAASLVVPAIAAPQSTVELWTFIDPAADDVRAKTVKKILELFQERNPGVTVKTSVIAWNEIGSAVLRAARARRTPDVTMLMSTTLPQQIAAKALQPLDPYLAKLEANERNDLIILPESVRMGKTWGVPWELRAWGLVYRADLLKKLNLAEPDSLPALIEVAKKMQADQGPDFGGFVPGFNPVADRAIKMFIPAALNMGAKVLHPDGTADFDSPQMLKVMNFLHDAVTKDKVMPLSMALMTPDQILQLQESGRVGFDFQGTQWLSAIRDKGAPGTAFNWMPMPSFEKGKWQRAAIEGWNLSIPVGAKNPDGGWALMRHWTSPEIQLLQTKMAGLLPIRASLAKDPAFNTPSLEYIKRALAYANNHPIAFDWPDTTPALQDTIGNAITAVLADKMTPEAALKDAEKNYNNVAHK